MKKTLNIVYAVVLIVLLSFQLFATDWYIKNGGAGTVDTDGFRFGAYNWTMASGEAIYFDNIIFSTTRLPLD